MEKTSQRTVPNIFISANQILSIKFSIADLGFRSQTRNILVVRILPFLNFFML
jgi:hypothetical protein